MAEIREISASIKIIGQFVEKRCDASRLRPTELENRMKLFKGFSLRWYDWFGFVKVPLVRRQKAKRKRMWDASLSVVQKPTDTNTIIQKMEMRE
ncbi:hypothetical protein WG66_003928, partial [Moniliophthora roreri]